jgi:AcrR family transcriptional regulator
MGRRRQRWFRILPPVEVTTPTRDRLVDAAMHLFAAQGYRGTSVGAIEAAAGLSPRAGGFYRHFPSKRDILDVVIARSIGLVVTEVSEQSAREFPSPRAELRQVGEDTLKLLRMQQALILLVARDGDQAPELADAVRDGLVEPGYQFMTMVFAKIAPGRDEATVRLAALQAAATLVTFVTESAIFGRAMTGIDDAELLDAWTAVWAGVLDLDEEGEPRVSGG